MFLPCTLPEIERLGWDAPDVILVSGDAYIDSPYSGVAMIGRVLTAAGFRVAMPSVIGTPERPISGGYIAGSALRMCVSREFAAFARRADRMIRMADGLIVSGPGDKQAESSVS